MDQTNTLDKSEEYSEMATVLFAGGFPAEAAKILDLGMTAKVFTGDTLAREKADLDRRPRGRCHGQQGPAGCGQGARRGKDRQRDGGDRQALLQLG